MTRAYKYKESLFTLSNQDRYSKKSIQLAKDFLKEYTIEESKMPVVTQEQRNALKLKYPNLYGN